MNLRVMNGKMVLGREVKQTGLRPHARGPNSKWLTGFLMVMMAFFAGNAFCGDIGPIQFPILGIGRTQTLRLTVLAHPPSPNFSATSCIAQLGFADLQGDLLPAVQKTVNLLPGQADFLDFPGSSALTALGQRMELRPIPIITPDPTTGGGADCIFSAEIYDPASGFSRVYTDSGPINLPGNEGLFPLMGVAFGQVLRFTAVAADAEPQISPSGGTITPGPCAVTLGFVDASGTERPPSPNLTLNPGQGGYVDFVASSTVTQIGQRALVRPVLTVESVPGADPFLGVQSSAEVFVRLTGATWSERQPGPIGEPAVQ
jgi:hypothetical protein